MLDFSAMLVRTGYRDLAYDLALAGTANPTWEVSTPPYMYRAYLLLEHDRGGGRFRIINQVSGGYNPPTY